MISDTTTNNLLARKLKMHLKEKMYFFLLVLGDARASIICVLREGYIKIKRVFSTSTIIVLVVLVLLVLAGSSK